MEEEMYRKSRNPKVNTKFIQSEIETKDNCGGLLKFLNNLFKRNENRVKKEKEKRGKNG